MHCVRNNVQQLQTKIPLIIHLHAGKASNFFNSCYVRIQMEIESENTDIHTFKIFTINSNRIKSNQRRMHFPFQPLIC